MILVLLFFYSEFKLKKKIKIPVFILFLYLFWLITNQWPSYIYLFKENICNTLILVPRFWNLVFFLRLDLARMKRLVLWSDVGCCSLQMRVLKAQAKYHQPVAFPEKIVKIWEREIEGRNNYPMWRIWCELPCWLADIISGFLLQLAMPLKMRRAEIHTMQGCISGSASSIPIKLVERTWCFINILRLRELKIVTLDKVLQTVVEKKALSATFKGKRLPCSLVGISKDLVV